MRSLAALVILIVLGLFFFIMKPMVSRLSIRVWRAAEGWSESARGMTSSSKMLIQENDFLQERVRFLEEQNKLLRFDHADRFTSDSRTDVVMAHVIKRGAVWTVDAGAKDGLVPGSVVYYGDNAIGTLAEVSDTFSTVEPFFTHGRLVQAVQYLSSMSLEITGRGQGVYLAKLPRDFEIALGDPIVWQGTREVTLLGYVESILFDDRDALQQVFIALPMNPKTIQWVEIETESTL